MKKYLSVVLLLSLQSRASEAFPSGRYVIVHYARDSKGNFDIGKLDANTMSLLLQAQAGSNVKTGEPYLSQKYNFSQNSDGSFTATIKPDFYMSDRD